VCRVGIAGRGRGIRVQKSHKETGMPRKTQKESFETALARLEEIAGKLERGEMPLEEALRQYEEGVKAYRYCSALLAEVEKKIEVLTKDEKGALGTAETTQFDA
jgi:exodeoxyribonuclease VII small subunit